MNMTEAKEAATLGRMGSLKLMAGADMPVLSARLPANASADEFGRAARGAYELISKLTGHACLSGRIKFVVEDLLFNDVTRVDLKTGQLI